MQPKRTKTYKRRGNNKVSLPPSLFSKTGTKILAVSDTWIAGAAGGFSISVPISTTVSLAADYNSMSAVYQQVRIDRVEIVLYSDFFYNTSGVATYLSNLPLGYSPSDSTVPTSMDSVLQQTVSKVHRSGQTSLLRFKPLTSTGVYEPVPYSTLSSNTAFYGYIRAYCPNGTFPNGVSIALVVYKFYTTWNYGE
jgi:hypothetical protein